MKKSLLLFATLLMCAGCATIICGSRQDISFDSSPDGATVLDNGIPIGRTPLDIRLQRSVPHPITIQLDGYKPYRIEIRKTFNGWYVGNLFFGGIIGLIIDPITGAMFTLTPDQVFTDFGASSAPVAPAAGDSGAVSKGKTGDRIFIAVTLQKSPDWKQIGTLERADE